MKGFYFLIKIKSGLKGLKNPLNLFIFIMLLVGIGLYAYLFSLLTNQAESGDVGNLTVEDLQMYFLSALIFITLLRIIFPAYSVQRPLLPVTYPLSRWQHYVVNVTSDFIRPYFFYVLLFLISCFVFQQNNNLLFFFAGILALGSAQLTRRIIQYFIDNKLKKQALLVPALFVLILSTTYFWRFSWVDFGGWPGLILFLMLLGTGFFLESNQVELKTRKSTNKHSKSWLYVRLIFNNKKVRIPLLIGLGLKILLIGADLFLVKTKGVHLLNGEFIYWIFVSPLVFFTYVFNNVWGFWKPVWLNIETRTGDVKQLLRQHIKLMVLPLVADMVITLPLLYLTWDKPIYILAFYFTSVI
ncbi:MAG: hypothetical protein WC341_17145, partial [Bacteroidales bacterium]